jgi:hypothetical protein
MSWLNRIGVDNAARKLETNARSRNSRRRRTDYAWSGEGLEDRRLMTGLAAVSAPAVLMIPVDGHSAKFNPVEGYSSEFNPVDGHR